MLKSYKNRELFDNQLVEVYRNLHNGLFSIRDPKTKLVLAHGEDFLLKNCIEKISETGRQKVIRERSKNVHAYIVGNIVLKPNLKHDVELNEISYNPYKDKHFILKETKQPIFNKKTKNVEVYFLSKKSWLLKNNNEE